MEKRRAKLLKNGCIEFLGRKDRAGYGILTLKIKDRKRNFFAHRMAYSLFVGQLDRALVIDHICRNRACINPDHLRQITNTENVMAEGSHSLSALNAKKTHCPKGHEFSAENTFRDKRTGHRQCRKCRKTHYQKWYENGGREKKRAEYEAKKSF